MPLNWVPSARILAHTDRGEFRHGRQELSLPHVRCAELLATICVGDSGGIIQLGRPGPPNLQAIHRPLRLSGQVWRGDVLSDCVRHPVNMKKKKPRQAAHADLHETESQAIFDHC